MNKQATTPSSTRPDLSQSQNVIKNQYYIHYPRNFGNEYTVYVANTLTAIRWCEQESEAALGYSNETFSRITREHAIHRGIKALREHVRDRDAGRHVDALAGGLYGFVELTGHSYSAILNDSAAQLADAQRGSAPVGFADIVVCNCGHVTVNDHSDLCEVCGSGGEDNE
jgi:hypothetical protein